MPATPQNRQLSIKLARLFPKISVHKPGLDFITWFCVFLLVVQIALFSAGGFVQIPSVYDTLGLSWVAFANGYLWQVFTYAFLHGNWVHFLSNVLLLWFVGGRILHILGQRALIKIIFVSVIAGATFHLISGLWLMQQGMNERQLVGISAACFGLLLTLTTISPDSRMWPIPVSAKNLGLAILVAECSLWLMDPQLAVPGFRALGQIFIDAGAGEIFRISHACHFGGALAGWILARLMLKRPPNLQELRDIRARNEEG